MPPLKVTIKGEVFPFDNERYPVSEAIELESKLGMPFHAWKTALASGSVKALRVRLAGAAAQRPGRRVGGHRLRCLRPRRERCRDRGGGRRGPYRGPIARGRWQYLGIFAERLGIRPWEWDRLTVAELDQLIRYLEMTGGHRGG